MAKNRNKGKEVHNITPLIRVNVRMNITEALVHI
jgi:hypothetical protein